MIMIPDFAQLGATAIYTVGTDTGERPVRARFIGYGTSYSDEHTGHPPGEFISRGKCQACRWFEIRIYDVPTQNAYVIDYIGRTVIPGELDRHWHVLAVDDDALIDRLASPDRGRGPRFFSRPAQQAIRTAVEYIPDLAAAYEEHPAYQPTLPSLS
jgi:hypothetical protein